MSTNEDTQRRQIGKRLKETREYLGLSQDEVANVVKIARPAISLIESGERKVDALELKKFADLYRQPVAYFIDEEDDATATMPKEVAFLARTATQLTSDDQKELLRFAQFLKAKTRKTP